MGESLRSAAIADKIVGSAAAMLKEQGVNITTKNLVPRILNRDGTDLCPFEKLAQGASSPSRLFSALESFFTEHNQ